MNSLQRIPSAATVAGSDSGGGAGIQADLKTFAALNVHGLSALTCITAQNPRSVSAVQACSVRVLSAQLEALAAFKPRAMKTGMLYSRQLIDVVAAFVHTHPNIRLVVDPVMVATSGANLLKPSAVSSLRTLFTHATLITPNLPEAAALCGEPIVDIEGQRRAARKLHRCFGCAVLVKGGHTRNVLEVADVLYDGKEELLLTAPAVKTKSSHGTGCTLSAAITAHLALGRPLSEAVAEGKTFITAAILACYQAGPFTVLNPFWK